MFISNLGTLLLGTLPSYLV